MRERSYQQLDNELQAGRVYRRENLLSLSKAVDRDLASLLQEGRLEKVAPGLYYKPANSPYGSLPPDDKKLVQTFLRDNTFLLYSWNEYNALGLGLTQLYNQMVVYNYKRHGVFQLADKSFDFRRPARGFPKKLSKEFLLVDLVNNLNQLAEDENTVKLQIKRKLHTFNVKQVHHLAQKYGKVATQRFFKEIINQTGFYT